MTWTVAPYLGHPDDEGSRALAPAIPACADFLTSGPRTPQIVLAEDLLVDAPRGTDYIVLIRDDEPFWTWAVRIDGDGQSVRIRAGVVAEAHIL